MHRGHGHAVSLWIKPRIAQQSLDGVQAGVRVASERGNRFIDIGARSELVEPLGETRLCLGERHGCGGSDPSGRSGAPGVPSPDARPQRAPRTVV